jgi:UDP-N-acetylmuramoylalanine--D-glutamate ligase
MMELQGKRALVVGLARSGRAAARILSRKGAVVTVTDTRPPASFPEEIPELTRLKIGLELGLHRDQTFLRQDLIVVSPGVPWDLPQLEAARQRQIPVLPEIEVASWFLQGSLLGITGSNGKTTTTSLLGRMLESSGFPTFVGGNIGVPLISAVEQARHDSLLVAELSSFQLEAIRSFRPHVAVLLNLSQNHLDRHHSYEAYVGAKARIFQNQTAEDYAILNADDPEVMNLAPAIASQKIFFSRTRDLPDGVFVSKGHIIYRVGNLERILWEASDVRLRGDFNVDDVLAASAAACVVGAEFGAIRQSVREFKGVEHRLEFVRQIHRVDFYNDSKATSVDATAKALTAFHKGVHLILGGKDKGAPYTPLRPLLKDRVSEVLLIGEAADKIAKDLEGAVEIVRAGDLETAVRKAFNVGLPGDAVLLAPACASFDQFHDYEERGRVFKDLVADLAREATLGVTVHPMESAPAAPPVPTPSEPLAEPRAHEDAVPQSAEAEVEARPPEETEPPVPEPRQEGPKPDLIYLFEVDAQEFAPAPDDLPMEPWSEEPEFAQRENPVAPAGEGDEVLPYEVAPAAHTAESGPAGHLPEKSETETLKKDQASLFEDARDSGHKSEA